MPVTVGQRAQRSLMLTSDHVKTFADLTGDYNPLHFDADFSAGTRRHEADTIRRFFFASRRWC
jgi:acyl dehydratase